MSELAPGLQTAGFLYSSDYANDAGLEWAARAFDINCNGFMVSGKAAALGINQEYWPYIPPTTMAPLYQDWFTTWAAANGEDPENCYYHAYEDMTFVKFDKSEIFIPGWGGGSATTRAESRIISGFYNASTNYPTGGIGITTWRNAMAAWLEDLQNVQYPYTVQTGAFMDSWMSMVYEGAHPENWKELIDDGATDYASAVVLLQEAYTSFLSWLEAEMKSRLSRDSYHVAPNIVDPSGVNRPYFNDERYKWWQFEWFMSSGLNGYPRGSGVYRVNVWDLLKTMYDYLEAGRKMFCHVQTNYTKEYAVTNFDNITEVTWLGFCQQEIAAYYLIHHANNWFGFHEGGANYYGPWAGLYEDTHWHPNMEYDLGDPAANGTTDYWGETGTDRFWVISDDYNPYTSQDKVLARRFDNGMVVCRFYYSGIANIGLVDPAGVGLTEPATFDLGGTYRQLLEDNTLGEAVTEWSLLNGQGAILIGTSDTPTPTPTPAPTPVSGNVRVISG